MLGISCPILTKSLFVSIVVFITACGGGSTQNTNFTINLLKIDSIWIDSIVESDIIRPRSSPNNCHGTQNYLLVPSTSQKMTDIVIKLYGCWASDIHIGQGGIFHEFDYSFEDNKIVISIYKKIFNGQSGTDMALDFFKLRKEFTITNTLQDSEYIELEVKTPSGESLRHMIYLE